jgi:hypothetical protein
MPKTLDWYRTNGGKPLVNDCAGLLKLILAWTEVAGIDGRTPAQVTMTVMVVTRALFDEAKGALVELGLTKDEAAVLFSEWEATARELGAILAKHRSGELTSEQCEAIATAAGFGA